MFNIGKFVCNRQDDKTAFIWIGKNGEEERYTYRELECNSNSAANFLKSLDIVKGDRVFVYIEKVPELYFLILGILKIGAVYCPVFSSFGSEALKDRIEDCQPRAIITQPSLVDNIRNIKVDFPYLENVIIVDKQQGKFDYIDKEINYIEEVKKYPSEFNDYETTEDDIAIIHYTSGTTSKPKGVVHRHNAVKRHLYTSKEVLGIKDEDIYWCTADHAWVTGSSYGIFGPLALGTTMVAADVGYRAKNIFEIIQKYKVNVWYTAPTLLRMLMREREELIRQYDFTSLREVACVGEALNSEVVRWGKDNLGKTIRDTWFQTETGSIMIANYGDIEVKPGSMGKPAQDIEAAVLDDNYNPLPPGAVGHLAIKPGWSSMFVTYWSRQEAYDKVFRRGWYITGDLVKRDEDGYYWFSSRNDDVINTAGHLVSPFEIESVLIKHKAIAEVAVIGIHDNIMGEKVKAFVVLKEGFESSTKLEIELRMLVRNELSPYASPQVIEFMRDLPKNNSGKIMRRSLREL